MSVNAIETVKSTLLDNICFGFGVHQCTSEGVNPVDLAYLLKNEGTDRINPQDSTETRVSE